MSDLAIEARGLSKQFGPTLAVDRLDLEVAHNEVFGFLGPNGAGKTTVVKMLLDLVRPTAGTALVLGRPPDDWRLRARIGFLPEHFRFQEWLTAVEFLDVHGRLYGMDGQRRRRRAQELLEMLDLGRHAQKPLQEFSKGMLQRIGLAQALMNDPDLVFLDEPTSGLDPLGRRLVRDVIRSLRGQGTTVFLNSHLLSEIEITCDRVAFIRRGRVVHSGQMQDLLAAETEVEVGLDRCDPAVPLRAGQMGWNATLDGNRLSVRLATEDQVPDLVAWLVGQGARVRSVVPRHLSLEEVFLRLMEGEEAG